MSPLHLLLLAATPLGPLVVAVASPARSGGSSNSMPPLSPIPQPRSPGRMTGKPAHHRAAQSDTRVGDHSVLTPIRILRKTTRAAAPKPQSERRGPSRQCLPACCCGKGSERRTRRVSASAPAADAALWSWACLAYGQAPWRRVDPRAEWPAQRARSRHFRTWRRPP